MSKNVDLIEVFARNPNFTCPPEGWRRAGGEFEVGRPARRSFKQRRVEFKTRFFGRSRRIHQFSLQKSAPSEVEFALEVLIFEVLTGRAGVEFTVGRSAGRVLAGCLG